MWAAVGLGLMADDAMWRKCDARIYLLALRNHVLLTDG